jgi:hypothetical protein
MFSIPLHRNLFERGPPVLSHVLQMDIPISWIWDTNPSPANRTQPYWRLQHLSLRQAGLTGALPSPWYLPFLTRLDLSRNALTGNFYGPLLSNASAGAPPAIDWLDLSFNSLSGNISAALIQWASLRSMSLRNNIGVNGLMPTGAALSNLRALDLQFTSVGAAELPPLPDLSNLTALRELHLGGTQHSGSIPASWSSGTNSNKLVCVTVAPNPNICGAPPEWLGCLNTTGTKICEYPSTLQPAVAPCNWVQHSTSA